MTKPSQINIQLPISSLFTLRGSRLLPPLTSSIPPGGRGNVLSVHLKSDLYIVGIKVTYVTSFVAAFPDLKQTALQVVLQLAWALMKALRSESSSDVTTCSDVSSEICTLQDSVAPQSTSARLLEIDNYPLFRTSCGKFVLSLCTLQLPSVQSPVDPACSRSIICSPPQSSQGSRTSSWWSCPLSMLSSRVAQSSKSCRQIRFFRGPHLQSDAQTTPLSRGVCTNAAPQNEERRTDSGLQTEQEDCQVEHQR